MSENIQRTNRYEDRDVVENYAKFTGLKKVETYLLKKYFKKGQIVLDIGCGTGRTTIELHQRAIKVIGMDYSWAMCLSTKNNFADLFISRMDATGLAVQSGSVDIALFSFNGLDTIVPYSSRLASLKEMIRIVKPGGLLVYSSKNIYARILNRFQTKSFLNALLSNLSEFKVQIFQNWKLFRQGYILKQTNLEGAMNGYAGTLKKNIKQIKELTDEFELLEVSGIKPDEPLNKANRNSYMLYYVWQRKQN